VNVNAKSKWIVVLGLTAIAMYCVLPAGRARALSSCMSCPGVRFTFGMMGIAAGQTARLNIVNALPIGPPNLPVGPPIRVTLMFVDANGSPFNIGGTQLRTTVMLSPGQSVFLDLNGDALPIGPPTLPSVPPQRAQVRALVSECDRCSDGLMVASLEVFDNVTGKTTLVMPDTAAMTRSHGED